MARNRNEFRCKFWYFLSPKILHDDYTTETRKDKIGISFSSRDTNLVSKLMEMEIEVRSFRYRVYEFDSKLQRRDSLICRLFFFLVSFAFFPITRII